MEPWFRTALCRFWEFHTDCMPHACDDISDYEIGEITELEYRNSIDKILLNNYHKTDITEKNDSDLNSEFSVYKFTEYPKLIDSLVIYFEKIGSSTQNK